MDITSSPLEHLDLDAVPRFLLVRDILCEPVKDSSLKEKILMSKLVRDITDQQFKDGSWDRFHTLNSDSSTNITTENALRRLLVLGLDKNDVPIKKALSYMERYLNKELDIRDRKEGLSDWEEITDLFVAAWILEIDRNSRNAGSIADKWAMLINRSFTGDSFCYDDYKKAFRDIFHTRPGKRAWDIECFHIAAILAGRLDRKTEQKFIDYILNNDKGLYYVRRGSLTRLPGDFMSRDTGRFLYAHLILSRYSCYSQMSGYVVDWLMENRGEDGLWDLGASSRDQVLLPFSTSWRKPLNRRIDSTVLIQKYLTCVTG